MSLNNSLLNKVQVILTTYHNNPNVNSFSLNKLTKAKVTLNEAKSYLNTEVTKKTNELKKEKNKSFLFRKSSTIQSLSSNLERFEYLLGGIDFFIPKLTELITKKTQTTQVNTNQITGNITSLNKLISETENISHMTFNESNFNRSEAYVVQFKHNLETVDINDNSNNNLTKNKLKNKIVSYKNLNKSNGNPSYFSNQGRSVIESFGRFYIPRKIKRIRLLLHTTANKNTQNELNGEIQRYQDLFIYIFKYLLPALDEIKSEQKTKY